jgi:hypothetical protein
VAKASAAVTKASDTASDIKKWRKDRDAITESRSVEQIRVQIALDWPKVNRLDRDAWEVTSGCTHLTADTRRACGLILPTLEALETAKRRDDLTKKISDAEKPQKGAPTTENKQDGAPAAEGNRESTTPITTADPQSEMVPRIVKWVTRGKIEPTPDDIVLVRILQFAVPPALAGLFLMFATALLAPPRTTSQRLSLAGVRSAPRLGDDEGSRSWTTQRSKSWRLYYSIRQPRKASAGTLSS